MAKDREERAFWGSTGVRFAYVGELSWGSAAYADRVSGDVPAWRCSSCGALVTPDETEQTNHALGHARIDELETALNIVCEDLRGDRIDELETTLGHVREDLRALAAAVDRRTPGVGTEQAQLVNDHAREQRIAGYREGIGQGKAWRGWCGRYDPHQPHTSCPGVEPISDGEREVSE